MDGAGEADLLARRVPAAVTLCCVAVMLAAIPWQMRWGVIPDTSWIITICERLLAGERLYADIIETNPPATVWLYLPPVRLAGVLGMAPEPLVHLYTYLACAGGLALAVAIARKADFPEGGALLPLLPAFLALLVVFPGNSFSEREHIGTALLLPLLVLAAWRAMLPLPENRPPLALSVPAGIAGAVIVLVKPYYVVLVLGPALYVAARQRSLRPLFSPEYLVSAALCVAYGVAVLVLYPAFMRDIYPMLGDTYMLVRRDAGIVLRYGPILAAWLLLMWLPHRRSAASPLAMVLAIASAAAYLPLLYQGKGWPYHAFPAIALGIGALLCRFLAVPPGEVRRTSAPAKAALALFVAVAWIPYLPTQKPDGAVVAAVRAAAPASGGGPTVGLVGSSIESGHPFTRMIGGRWISAYCSDWLGAFAVHLGRDAHREGREADAARYDALAERRIAARIEELRTDPPDILLEESGTLWLEMLRERQAYRDILADYRLLATMDGLAVYGRDPDPLTDRRESRAAASG